MKFPVIPRRIKISKRLAQCMHPALPSGVHLKALETYDIIFKFYETHFVPLGERLRPGLSGFLSGVLPGLEEGSDHFDRYLGPAHFYGCLWECLASNSGIRLPAISFVLTHFNKRQSMEDQLYVMGTNIDVMVNALCAGVQDTSVLVQRSALDLLLVGFPMHNSQLVRADMIRLVTAALVTILRRDMRLFAWLLGSEVNISLLSSEHPLVKKSKGSDVSSSTLYFDMYSRDMLIQAIKITLSQGVGETPHDLRPYRLLVSLLDKPDIGPVILDDILYEVFRTLYFACENAEDAPGKGSGNNYNHKGSHELLKCANLLFSTLEPCYIWIYAGTLFDEACERQTTNDEKASPEHESSLKGEVKPVGSGPPNLLEVCTLSEFLLDTVSLETYMDTPSEHLPGLFLHIITQLTQYCDALLPQEVARSLQLCAKILSRVQPSAVGNQSESVKISSVEFSDEKIQFSIQSDLAKSTSDVSNGQSDLSRVSDLSESSKTSKEKSEGKKLTSKMKKSYSAKFRTKHSKNSLSSYSVSSPVLLSVVKSDSGDRSPVEDKRIEDITKSAETINTISTVITHLDRQSPDLGSRSAGPSLESGLNKMDSDLGRSNTSFNKPLIVTSPPEIHIPSKQQTVLEQCIRQYEKFYVKFVGGQRVINGRKISELFQELLVVLPCETNEKRAAKLERLLYRCLNVHEEDSYSESSYGQSSSKSISFKSNSYESWVQLKSISVCQGEQWEEPMKVASSLLVELSTFPNYCLPGDSSLTANEPMDLCSFPEWLQVLVVCSCWLSSVPSLQLVAISTLLDLISLLRSQCEATGSPETGVVAVVMVPLLKPWHVEYIEHHTNVVTVLANSLWHHLGQLGSEHKVTCVELLHQLHNVLPSNESVENIIGESLTEENIERRVDAFQRFALLWHIGREVETKAGMNRNFRTFDKSLLKMLDNLQLSESCPLKLQAQSWLLHSLLRGDISRLLDPLLYMLLDPVTARMSVLHSIRIPSLLGLLKTLKTEIIWTKMQHTRAVKDAENGDNMDENAATAKIYAISSVDGNVIYHVSDSTDQRKFKNRKEPRRNISNPVRAKRIFAVTTLVGGGKRENHYITEKNTYVKELESALALNRPQIQNISVFVNPFSSTANNSNTSNDSATEDEYGRISTAHECIRNATRFHQNGKGSEMGREEKPADILDSNSRSNSNPDFSKCVSKFEAGNRRLKKGIGSGFEEGDEGGDSSSESMTNGGLEIVNGVVQRWSVGDEEVLRELEESTTAEEYFGTGTMNNGDSSSISVVEEILQDVLHMVVSQCSDGGNTMGVGVHALHSHMLLYCGVYDSHRTLYALSSLRSILLTNARMFLCAAATTGLTNVSRSCGLLVLLARHRKSVFGRNFHGDIAASSGEFGTTYRSSMYLEVLISVCLYFARSYYPNLGQMRLTQEEIAGNRQSYSPEDQSQPRTFTEEIVFFNDPVNCQKGDAAETPAASKESTPTSTLSKVPQNQLKYNAGHLIPQQPMFLNAVVSALKLDHMRHLHQHWTTLLTSALPYMGASLTHVVVTVVNQLCCNLEKLSAFYSCSSTSSLESVSQSSCCLPADYTVTQLEALTVLCHYCLLDSTQQLSHAFSQTGSGTIHMGIPGANPGQIFNNLIHVFMPTPLQQDGWCWWLLRERGRWHWYTAKVDEVVGIMRVNVEKVLERDQKLSELDNRADALQQGAAQFEQQAGKLKRKYWWKNLKMMIIMPVIALIIIVIIIIWASSGVGGDSSSSQPVESAKDATSPPPPNWNLFECRSFRNFFSFFPISIQKMPGERGGFTVKLCVSMMMKIQYMEVYFVTLSEDETSSSSRDNSLVECDNFAVSNRELLQCKPVNSKIHNVQPKSSHGACQTFIV
ncbi:hypothetical protein C0J52_14759 [Blattella germanica]|nr:hypothetical protein C0J52_14759 [Blattella germanica]